MRAAIKALRARLGPDRPIFEVHIDQAANDFNTLFDVLRGDPERYSVDDPNIFPSAIGRSFKRGESVGSVAKNTAIAALEPAC
jgi:hypothetical protein